MKILHVITSINRGGAENHLVELIAGQLALGHEVRVAYLKGDGYWRAGLEARGVPVDDLGLRRYGDWRPLARLKALLVEFGPDVIHAHMPPAEVYTVLATRVAARTTPLVISKHNDEPFYRGPGERALGRWAAGACTRMIAISSAVERYMAGPALGVPPEKLRVIRYGLDVAPYLGVGAERRDALRHAWGVRGHERVIGTVSRLAPQKALHVMLDGFARHRQASVTPAKLVIVGTGPLEAELKEQADRLGIATDVVWAGFQEDIPAVMAAFDVFALTSIYEGFGLVLLEAMAAGRPIVASEVSAIPEIVEHERTGLLIPPLDPEAFRAALARLDDAAVRQSFGEQGRRRAVESFSPSRMADATMAVYAKCLGSTP